MLQYFTIKKEIQTTRQEGQEKHRRRQLFHKREAHELRRQGLRIVRRLPHLQHIARGDQLQPDGAEGLQQRGAPPGQHHTLLRLLQYGNVEPGIQIH